MSTGSSPPRSASSRARCARASAGVSVAGRSRITGSRAGCSRARVRVKPDSAANRGSTGSSPVTPCPPRVTTRRWRPMPAAIRDLARSSRRCTPAASSAARSGAPSGKATNTSVVAASGGSAPAASTVASRPARRASAANASAQSRASLPPAATRIATGPFGASPALSPATQRGCSRKVRAPSPSASVCFGAAACRPRSRATTDPSRSSRSASAVTEAPSSVERRRNRAPAACATSGPIQARSRRAGISSAVGSPRAMAIAAKACRAASSTPTAAVSIASPVPEIVGSVKSTTAVSSWTRMRAIRRNSGP